MSSALGSQQTGDTSFERDVFLIPDPNVDVRFGHILSADLFGHDHLAVLFERAEKFRELDMGDAADRAELAALHVGRQVCSLFYEPSTRTRLSFETAAVKMGMGVVSTEAAEQFSSAAKGETIEDTIRVLDEYNYDAIVLRHNEKGAAVRASEVCDTPIINAGDGAGEHPTQSLLDAYTIAREFDGQLGGLNIVIGGDLRYGRTARSIAKLLSQFPDNHITFVSVPELQIGEDILRTLEQTGTTYQKTDDMLDAFSDADVIYWTRLQKERLENPSLILDESFTIDNRALGVLPQNAIIMHPLPRVGEIAPEVDADPRARYFEQAGNGLYLRMALLHEVVS